MTDPSATPITGNAGGVPFLAVPPEGGVRRDTPVVVGWHLFDPPATEAAFAAALPLAGLDAWRVYLGLPMSASRPPDGGFDELMRLGYEDAVLNLFGPSILGAANEFGPALVEIRRRLAIDGGLGLMGGSAGAGVALLVMAEGGHDIDAVVAVSPLVQLRGVVAANERHFGITYAWSEASSSVADRIDFVARSAQIAAVGAPLLLIVGEQEIRGYATPRQLSLRRFRVPSWSRSPPWPTPLRWSRASSPHPRPPTPRRRTDWRSSGFSGT